MGQSPIESSGDLADSHTPTAEASNQSDAAPKRSAWRRVRAVLIALFCIWHLTALLIGNLSSLKLHEQYGKDVEQQVREAIAIPKGYASAINSEQWWVMFSPNVATESKLPALRLTFLDGSLYIVRANHALPLENADNTTPESLNPDAPEKLRRYRHEFAWGGGRMRKLEERVGSTDGYTARGQAWARWRLTRHLQGKPEHAAQLAKVEVLSITIEHPQGTDWPLYGGYERLFNYRPDRDEEWRGPELPSLGKQPASIFSGADKGSTS